MMNYTYLFAFEPILHFRMKSTLSCLLLLLLMLLLFLRKGLTRQTSLTKIHYDPPASTSQVLGIKACTTMPHQTCLFMIYDVFNIIQSSVCRGRGIRVSVLYLCSWKIGLSFSFTLYLSEFHIRILLVSWDELEPFLPF